MLCSRVQQKPLSPDGSLTEQWMDPPVEVTSLFYLFNITNPTEVIALGHKPFVKEMGPYGFREKVFKADVRFDAVNSWVRYRQEKTYFFDPSLSCDTCTMDDLVTVPNIVLQVCCRRRRCLPPIHS